MVRKQHVNARPECWYSFEVGWRPLPFVEAQIRKRQKVALPVTAAPLLPECR